MHDERVIPFSGPPSSFLPLVNRMTFALFVPLLPACTPARLPSLALRARRRRLLSTKCDKKAVWEFHLALPSFQPAEAEFPEAPSCTASTTTGRVRVPRRCSAPLGVMIFPPSGHRLSRLLARSLGRRICPAPPRCRRVADRSRRKGRRSAAAVQLTD